MVIGNKDINWLVMKLDKDLEDREKKLLGKPLTGSKQCGYLYQKKEAESSTAE